MRVDQAVDEERLAGLSREVSQTAKGAAATANCEKSAEAIVGVFRERNAAKG